MPVYVGMRNWNPYLQDTLAQMSRDGVRRAVGFIAAAHRSYSSCTQYKENVAAARAALRTAGLADVEITYAGDWHTDEGFVEANAAHVHDAFARAGDDARLVFTAHSIPVSMAERFPYERQLHESAAAISASATLKGRSAAAAGKGRPAYDLVFQSRSGRPEDPWLGPDICEYLRTAAAAGLTSVVVSPVGFICDHVEVLYDLDLEAAAVAKDLGITFARASTVNDHPKFIETMARAVTSTIDRYRGGRPLQIVAGS